MHVLKLEQFLDEQDLIVKGNLVCEKRYKGSGFRGLLVQRSGSFNLEP
jgi:hypothetical protein